ncbi:MAG: GAF domain-containing protein [Anaerolineae bacterium]|jgi:transcriptional regulator with GAF, ATPase, and Fis domain
MARIRLKRVVDRNREVIRSLTDAINVPIGIVDADGRLVLGDLDEGSSRKHPVELEGEVFGWVIGGDQTAAIGSLLSYLVGREVEKRTLADEVLDRYREINLLYNLSEKLTASLELQSVVQVALEEANRLISGSSGAVMLVDEEAGTLRTILGFGQEDRLQELVRPGEGIIGSIAQTGQAEIVNDVASDPRACGGLGQVASVVCAPLKAQQKVAGAIFIGSREPVTYAAADLKLLSTIASQAAPAIDNALLYEREMEAARRREERLKEQIDALRIELSEAKQARQVAEITETDYFRRLQAQAQDLRKIIDGP